ncbi:MAG: acyl-CoA dehydrogenase [Bryobacteraceae bacterium]|nr:MAG: acyl-CoA dehydrogenase [Bryobacteraceae bacterium]
MPIRDLTSGRAPAPLLEWNEEEAMFRAAVAEFARQEIAPRVRAMDEAGKLEPALLRQLFEVGLMGIEIPEELGGQGGTFTQALIAIEELAKVDPAVAVVVDVQNTLVNTAVRRWGTAEQQRRWLPRLAADTLGAYALSEAGAGSDAFALAARAARDGGDYVLTGRKLWITNAAEAGLFLVFANANPEAGHRGITCFVVEREARGLTVGRKEDKLGIRASSTCELILDGVRVSEQDVLGEPGKGYRIAMETLNEGRIGIGAQMTGLAAAALTHAIGYAKQRKQFGQPIAEFQAVRMELARMATDIEAARLLVYNAARRREAGLGFVKEAAMAKYRASEIAETVASRAIEIFGGVGFTRDYPVEKLYRDAKIGRIYEGTTNMQLLTIAKHVLS